MQRPLAHFGGLRTHISTIADVARTYRCYLIRAGRIAWGEYLDCNTTHEASSGARALWLLHPQSNGFAGIEVWLGATLVHREMHQAGKPAPIVSPFETAESTIYPTWHPTQSRPIGMSIMAHA